MKINIFDMEVYTKLNFYHAVWIFTIGSYIGYCIETFYVSFTAGHFVNRAGVLYGPFSQIYGVALLLCVIFLYQYRDRSIPFLFFISAFIGSIFEYTTSIFMEEVFRVVSWNYSSIPFNLNGRINLEFSLAWGILGMVFIKYVYDWICMKIDLMPRKWYKILTWIFAVFMAFNITISMAAEYRQSQRHYGIKATNEFEEFLDEHYPNKFNLKYLN